MTTLNYNGQIIDQRDSDSYVNLTQMAKANNVEVKRFNESEFAKRYLKALQETVSPNSRLTVTESTGFPAIKTTWGHPLVAIAFGQWISPEFHVWCNMHIKTLIETGKTELPSQPALQPSLPQNYLEALKALVASEEAKLALETKLIEAQPKIEYADAVACSDNAISMNEFAKLIGTGRTRLFKRLRELGVIMQSSTLPYQKYCDSGFFEVGQVITGIGVEPYALVTGKGQLWLCQKLGLTAKQVNQLRLF